MTLQNLPPQPAPYELLIGDIGISRDWIVTPGGTAPTRGAQWTVVDRVTLTRSIPTWAIVCAIVGAALCLLGLFFLLVKEDTYYGTVDVTVVSGGLSYTTHVYPTAGQQTVYQVRQQVWHAQRLAAG